MVYNNRFYLPVSQAESLALTRIAGRSRQRSVGARLLANQRVGSRQEARALASTCYTPTGQDVASDRYLDDSEPAGKSKPGIDPTCVFRAFSVHRQVRHSVQCHGFDTEFPAKFRDRSVAV